MKQITEIRARANPPASRHPKLNPIPLIIVVLLLSACGGGGTDTAAGYQTIHKGTTGLVIKTTEGAPPDEVPELQNFKVLVKLQNKGASDITDGILKMVIDEDNLEANTELVHNFELEGKSLFNLDGREMFLDFILASKVLTKEMGLIHDSELIITAYYTYYSELQTDVCVDPDVYDVNEGTTVKVCKMIDLTRSRGQGGPVEIYLIEPQYINNEAGVTPQYFIYVKNSGKGQVFKSESLIDVASGTPIIEDTTKVWNMVRISGTLSDEPLECEPAELNIGKEEAYVKCKASRPLEEQDAYIAPLRVRAEYGWTESIAREVRIISK